MLRQLQLGVMKKKLVVKKGPSVQGAVCVHFRNPNVKDIVLNDFSEVDVYKRINIQDSDIVQSNLEELMLRGDLIAVG